MTAASDEFFASHLAAVPVIGIFRGASPAETVRLCESAWGMGVELVEIPVQSPEAMPSLAAAVAAAGDRGRLVGAGTVTTLEQVAAVRDAGAAFTVAPGLDPDVARESLRVGLPHLPGVATSTEITRALRLGFGWQKAFPAAQLGPGWIAAQRGPFPDVKFVATGGMDASNAADFLASGCSAVAIGSAFGDPDRAAGLAVEIARWNSTAGVRT